MVCLFLYFSPVYLLCSKYCLFCCEKSLEKGIFGFYFPLFFHSFDRRQKIKWNDQPTPRKTKKKNTRRRTGEFKYTIQFAGIPLFGATMFRTYAVVKGKRFSFFCFCLNRKLLDTRKLKFDRNHCLLQSFSTLDNFRVFCAFGFPFDRFLWVFVLLVFAVVEIFRKDFFPVQ